MEPEDYLQQYTESFQSPKTESRLPPDESELILEYGYYYPSYQQPEAYLDVLSRADLLEIVRQVLSTEYPQQRLIRRQVDEYLETLQRLKDERTWRQVEIERLNGELERLNGELAWRINEMGNLGAERKRLETLVLDSHAELEHCRSRIAVLENECATMRATLTDLRASTSWKVTTPLRRFSGAVKTLLRPPED